MKHTNYQAIRKGFSADLGLDRHWDISKIIFDSEAGAYTIHVAHKRGKVVCPKTGERHSIYDHRRARTWRHTDINKYKCYIRCRIPRVKSSVGVKTIEVPWTDSSNQYTHNFAIKVIDHLKDTQNQTKTARALRCGVYRVGKIMEHSVAQGLERRGKVKVTHMSIDEKAVRRGHKYATILSDSETGVVLDLTAGRGYLETKSLVEKTLSEAHRVQLATFTMDMWAP